MIQHEPLAAPVGWLRREGNSINWAMLNTLGVQERKQCEFDAEMAAPFCLRNWT